MATLTGNNGTVKVGSNAVAEIRSFSVDETMDTIESTSMGDTYRTFETSLKSWSGSVDVFFDDTDTSVQVEGSTTGDHLLSGAAIVTGRAINSSFDGLVEASLSLQGDGALTEGTVS
jgi:hypothetical protein